MLLEDFYKKAKSNSISLAEFKFEKNNLNKPTKDFFTELLYYIAQLIYQINIKLPSFKNLDKKFVNNLNFFNKFYSFLKDNEDNFRTQKFHISDKDIDIADKILSDKEQYIKAFRIASRAINNNLKLISHDKTMFFDISLAEIFESCIKILTLILYLDEHHCQNEDLGDILFSIQHEIYEHMIPNHFENLDETKEGIRLIYQIDWLKENIKLVEKTQKNPTSYFN